MKYHELQVAATPDRKRVGRGIAAGQGKTAGRGTKGQGARTGKKLNAMFQGGQRPLAKAVPKARGFKSLRTPAQVVYLDHLNAFKGKTVDNAVLFEADLIGTPYQAVKVIIRGELTEKVTLHVAGASSNVVAAIVKAGGTFVKTPVPLKMSTKTAKKSDK
ncbi:MAG: rplO [Candidatus Saccharibacteria bacterium]|nr:rplO [Candidatus Saccharibacteria bacterium]